MHQCYVVQEPLRKPVNFPRSDSQEPLNQCVNHLSNIVFSLPVYKEVYKSEPCSCWWLHQLKIIGGWGRNFNVLKERIFQNKGSSVKNC